MAPSPLTFKRSRIAFFGTVSSANGLDWLVTLTLGALLTVMTLQLGGVRAETQLIGLGLSAALLILHGLWALNTQSDKPIVIHTRALAFAPFTLYLLIAWLGSPTPWTGRTEALMGLQAYGLFWVTIHSLGHRNHIWFLFLILGGIMLIGVMFSLRQYLDQVDDLPYLLNPLELWLFKLNSHPLYAGQATGSFAAPSSFATLTILALFPALVFAGAKHLRSILRFFCAYLALMALIVLLLTLSRHAILASLPALIVLPWALRVQWKTKLTIWILIGISAAGLFLVLKSSPVLQENWNQSQQNEAIVGQPQLYQAGIQTLTDYPWMGSGLGSYRYFFELNRPEGFTLSPIHAHNDYIEVLSDLGGLGFGLLFFPAAYLMGRGFQAWRKQPDIIALDEKGKDRRRARHMPVDKVFLCAVLLALLAVALHAINATHLYISALLFWIALFFAIIVKCSQSPQITLANRPHYRYLYFALNAGIALTLFFATFRGYIAETYAFEGERITQQFAHDFETLKTDPGIIQSRITLLETALAYNPGHSEARSQLALAYADKSNTDPIQYLELGQIAEQHARWAIEGFDRAPDYWIILAEALFLQERWAEAGQAYQTALTLSPNNPRAWYAYANWLNGEPGRREEALQAIERSLELNPNDLTAQQLKRKILIP